MNRLAQIFRRIPLLSFAVCMVEAAEFMPDPPPVRMPIVNLDKVEIAATRVADSLYLLEGQGGKITVLARPDGVLVVDGQFAKLTDKIVAAIRSFSDRRLLPLSWLSVRGCL